MPCKKKYEMLKGALFYFSVAMLFTSPAYAYLDSGTGSLIVQMLFAGFAGLLAIVRLYWEKLKTFCIRIKCWLLRKPLSSLISEQAHDKTDDKTR